MNYLSVFILSTFLFCLYVEYSVGGVFIRQTSSGLYSFNLYSGISYLLNPLYQSFLWNIQLLDVNYVFYISMISLIFYILN
jgi:hypothetical protein